MCGKLKEVAAGYGTGQNTWWMTHVVLEVVTCVLNSATLPLWTHRLSIECLHCDPRYVGITR
jgi:hypothetical protein